MRGRGSLEKKQIWGLLFNCAPIFWCCCLWIVCLELCFVEGRIRAKKCFHKNRAASRVFIKILFCSTIFKGAPLWGAHGSRGHGGTWSGAWRSGTDALPPARVGRGIAPTFCRKRSITELFGYGWRMRTTKGEGRTP